MRIFLAALVLTIGCSLPGTAQERVRLELAQAASPDVSSSAGFLAEAGAGAIGSAVGIVAGGLLLRPDACGSDDIACQLNRLSGVAATAALGSAAGTLLMANHLETPSSVLGAAVGSVVGVVAGVGVARLLEDAGAGDSRVAVIIEVAVVNGLLTAAGSRALAALFD